MSEKRESGEAGPVTIAINIEGAEEAAKAADEAAAAIDRLAASLDRLRARLSESSEVA